MNRNRRQNDRAPLPVVDGAIPTPGSTSVSATLSQWIFAGLPDDELEAVPGLVVNPNHQWILYPRYQGKHSLRALMFCACAVFGSILFLMNFVVDDTRPLKALPKFPDLNYEKCFLDNMMSQDQDQLVSPHTKVVFMVIDAWKLDFLTDTNSTMTFTRDQIELGRAILFNATANAPTVTMPRIKAMASGVVPSFASSITNFASRAAVEDSWVAKARSRKRRILFYGDDTWLRLYPDAFMDSHGVTSFYVNDYTEVDKNVTTHMREQLRNPYWDIMILHYLGLDHIGHSLGGDSKEIPRKLREMDKRIEEIYNKLAAQGPVLLVLAGDHGMNKQGSHGGSSPDETQVPIVLFHSRVRIRHGHKWNEELQQILQVDIATTMSALMGLPIPDSSRGLSLVPYLSRHWFISYKTLFYDNLYQAIHLLRFVERIRMLDDLGRVAHESRGLQCSVVRSIINVTQDAFRQYRIYQKRIIALFMMDWDRYSVTSGGLILISMVACALFAPDFDYLRHYGWKLWTHYDFAQMILCILPLCSFFSSSFVEEDHDTWNYFTSTMIVARLFLTVRHAFLAPRIDQNKALDDPVECQKRREARARALCRESLILLLLHRTAMGFTSESRRRWAMDPELLPPAIFPDHPYLMHISQAISGVVNAKMLANTLMPGTVMLLCTAYLYHRVSDYASCRPSRKYQLLVLTAPCLMMLSIRGILTIFGCSRDDAISYLFYPVCGSLLISLFISPSFTLIFYLSFLVRPQFFPLIVLLMEMGIRSRRVFIDRFFLAGVVQATLYYMGLSFSISSIDVAVGYTGLSSYIAAAVGFQIAMNAYAGPIVFLLAYNLFYTPSEDPTAELEEELRPSGEKWNERPFFAYHFFHYRMWILTVSLYSMGFFYEHLFAWTVFAPKALFEVVNTVVVALVLMVMILMISLQRFIKGQKFGG